MKTVLNIAVMIALCANTALVAADKTTAENDARNLMSNIVSSFESGDTRSIEKMVKDEKFRGSLLDMIRHSPGPLFLRLEMDSILMAEPFIVRVRCYAHRSLFPQRPVMADFKLEKCDGQYAVAGYWCRLEEEMARLYDVAFPACREMADSASRCDTNSVFRLFGADSVVDGGAKFREFLSKRGAEWVDDVMRKRLRVMYCDRMPAVPVDMTDAGMGVRAEFSVLKSDGTVASAVCVAFALPAALFGGNSRAREAALRRSAVERTANMEEYVPVDYEAESRRLQKERRELEQAMSILHVVGIPICSRQQGRHIGLN